VFDTFLLSCRVLGRGVEEALLVQCVPVRRRAAQQPANIVRRRRVRMSRISTPGHAFDASTGRNQPPLRPRAATARAVVCMAAPKRQRMAGGAVAAAPPGPTLYRLLRCEWGNLCRSTSSCKEAPLSQGRGPSRSQGSCSTVGPSGTGFCLNQWIKAVALGLPGACFSLEG